MNRILLATDGSPSAARATETAIELAQATGASLHVVTAWTVPVSAFGYGPLAPVADLGDVEHERATQAVAAAAALAEEAGVPVTEEVRQGFAVEQICAAAAERHADLVVVGAHGWSTFKRLLVGSVSTGVLHQAPCPVLVVRGAPAEADEEPVAAASTRA